MMVAISGQPLRLSIAVFKRMRIVAENRAATSGKQTSYYIYNHQPAIHCVLPFGETYMPQESKLAVKNKVMGDKSPKSNQKKSSQKHSKASSAAQKKQHAIAAKQAAGKKK
jgi:hypothetical protein